MASELTKPRLPIMKRYSLITTLLFLIISCTDRNATEPTGESDFALYFLADSSLGAYEAMEQVITELELESEPWLSEEDIEDYDFSSHCIYLKTDKRAFFECYDEGRFVPLLIDKPFVVVAGGIRYYIGSIHSGALSTAPTGPYMDELDVWFYPRDVMHISRAWSSEKDVRSMDQIREALSVLGLFHGGLEIRLNAVSIIENASISTVQYTFTIKNIDTDNLLVLDPDLMGSSRFHYFTNGVHFWHEATYYYSEYKEVIQPEPFDSWQPEWFTRIAAGDSVQRTVQLRGYPRIPAGSYECYLRFSNPHRIEKESRYVTGSRYWIGEITSDKIDVVVN